ncbi:MAG: PorV/PorQ family protein [Rhodothermales bacterium]|nr:PorV/PorQ family protein [Rhodothermales bacterium]
MRFLIPILLLLVLVLPARAQETGLNLLRVGVDAAAGAMGDARVASADDAFAAYWNPAGLAAGTRNMAAVSHRIWVADVRSYAVAGRFRAGEKGGIGLSVLATDLGDFEARTQPGDPDGFFSVSSLAVGASYGRRLGPLRAGLTGRYLSERIFDARADGYALDAGLQIGLLGEKLLLGAALQNLGSMSALAVEATELPTTVRAGAALSPLRLLTEDGGEVLLDVRVAAEVSYLTPTEEARVHGGAEATLLDLVTLRGGFITNDALRAATFGAGLAVGGVVFDYAFLPFESGFEGPGHLLTLHYAW